MKYVMICFATALIVILALNVLGSSEEDCISGGGSWTTPAINQGDDPSSNKKILPPFCKCDIGYYWNDSSKLCMNDSELRCSQTQGNWINNECQCPEGTIKWTPGFGCDMPGPVPLEKINTLTSPEPEVKTIPETKNDFYTYLVVLAIILFIMLLIYFLMRRRKK